MPVQIEATYRVVTPLYCAGTDDTKPELRLPSFKGGLRFWWRALAWSRYGGDLEKIKRQEDYLFGSTERGQSRVHMRLSVAEKSRIIRKKESVFTDSHGRPVRLGARYLGYGLMKAFSGRNGKAEQLVRGFLDAGLEFTVWLRYHGCREELAQLQDALVALGIFGGMGARSRKGWGSIGLQRLLVDGKECWANPEDIDDLREKIGQMPSTSGLPEYTAFSGDARYLVLSGGNVALELLDRIGRELVQYRSWGRNGKILNGIPSEQNFKGDHDLMKTRGPRSKHPRRIAFGLPHNYGRDVQVRPADHRDRRASPLFIHIHEIGRTPVGVLSFLPARFLPKRTYVSVGESGYRVPISPERKLYRPIHEFLDRLLNKNNQRKESFSNALEVKS